MAFLDEFGDELRELGAEATAEGFLSAVSSSPQIGSCTWGRGRAWEVANLPTQFGRRVSAAVWVGPETFTKLLREAQSSDHRNSS